MFRCDGRTQWMIDLLVDAVRDGQPYSIVVGRTQCHVEILKTRVTDGLKKAGMSIENNKLDRLRVEGSTVDFATIGTIQRKKMGVHAGIFYDHYCDEPI